MRTKIDFKSLTELKKIMAHHDWVCAEKRPIYIKGLGIDKKHVAICKSNNNIDDMYATMNTSHFSSALYKYIHQNEVYALTGAKYTLIQHHEMVKGVAEVMENMGLEVYGNIIDMGYKVYLHTFYNGHVIDLEDDDINLGARFSNSFDLSCGLNFSLYGLRLICVNGMYAKNILSSSWKKHVGEINILDVAYDFIEKSIRESDKFAELIYESMSDEISTRRLENLLLSMIKTKKHVKNIINELGPSLKAKNISRWSIYNALTSYISHGAKLTNGVIERLENISCGLLKQPLESLIEKYSNEGNNIKI